MTNKEKKQLARSLFIKSDLTRNQIALQAGCNEKTLRKWILEEGWQDIKEAETITRPELLMDAFKQLKALNLHIETALGGFPDKVASDAKAVIRKEIEALTYMPLHKYIEVSMEFSGWLQASHPEELQHTIALLDGFIQHLSAEKNS